MTSELLLAVGSYTTITGGRGVGITIVKASSDGRSLQIISEAPSHSPSFLCWDESGQLLFAANETAEGTVSSYRLNSDLTLKLIDTQPSHGGRPCYLAVHPSGQWLAVCNYAGGSVADLRIQKTGEFAPPKTVMNFSGSGSHPTRQDRPHPHAAIFTPDGLWMIVLDVGLDTISVYPCDNSGISPTPASVVNSTPGSGPRHGIWLDPATLAVTEEISGTVSLFDWDGNGHLNGPTHTVSSSAKADSAAWPSELQALNTSSIMVANRTNGTLTMRSFTSHQATESPRETVLPPANARHFWVEPTGQIAFVALQDSDRLVTVDLQSDQVIAEVSITSPAYIATQPTPNYH